MTGSGPLLPFPASALRKVSEGRLPDSSGWPDLSAIEGRPALGSGASRRKKMSSGSEDFRPRALTIGRRLVTSIAYATKIATTF